MSTPRSDEPPTYPVGMFVFISVVIGAFGGALLDFIPMGAASGAVIGAIIDSVLHPR